jgi:shikimate kinase
MKVAFIGHRGVGKSTYLAQLAKVYPKQKCLDLDDEIEKAENCSIERLFREQGEGRFRLLEQTYLNDIASQSNVAVALGAGFGGVIPCDFQVIWLRRRTDSKARIFFDRPRLNVNLLPSEEYLQRYIGREKKYRRLATRQIFLPEGNYYGSDFVQRSFQLSYPDLGGILTLLPENVNFVLKNIKNIGAHFFEVRSDLFNDQEFLEILDYIDPERVLLSYRPNGKILNKVPDNVLWDWDLALGESKFGIAPIVSTHSNDVNVSVLKKFSNQGSHIKVSPEVSSWKQLKDIENLLMDSLNSFSLVPRSPTGVDSKWESYRLFSKPKLSFFRIDEGSAIDQPNIDQFSTSQNQKHFAAVLGDPVSHSFSPSFHKIFFDKFDMPFHSIQVARGELGDSLLQYLYDQGLRFAALTSPCKKSLLSSSLVELDASCQEHQSINTLIWSDESAVFKAFNTDTDALLSELAEIDMKNSLIWGAGAMGEMIHAYYPEAKLESLRNPSGDDFSSIKTVVWSAGGEGGNFPEVPNAERIYDLSYVEFSEARELALINGLEYCSGKEMFEIQAKLQQDLWQEYGQ